MYGLYNLMEYHITLLINDQLKIKYILHANLCVRMYIEDWIGHKYWYVKDLLYHNVKSKP